MAGFVVVLGVLGALAAFMVRLPNFSSGTESSRSDPVAAPISIELEPPIPETSEASDSVSEIDLLPVAFPGYLLPGEHDGDEEYGHARP